MGLFLGHNIRIFHFFCIPFNFAFIPWHSHPLKQKLTVSPHTQCPLCWNSTSQTVQWPANLCLPKSEGNHVCLLSQLPRTHSNWTWIVLCSSVPLSPKKARECNYIKIYTKLQEQRCTTADKNYYTVYFFCRNKSSPLENMYTNKKHLYYTDMDMENEIFSCFWSVRPFY